MHTSLMPPGATIGGREDFFDALVDTLLVNLLPRRVILWERIETDEGRDLVLIVSATAP